MRPGDHLALQKSPLYRAAVLLIAQNEPEELKKKSFLDIVKPGGEIEAELLTKIGKAQFCDASRKWSVLKRKDASDLIKLIEAIDHNADSFERYEEARDAMQVARQASRQADTDTIGSSRIGDGQIVSARKPPTASSHRGSNNQILHFMQPAIFSNAGNLRPMSTEQVLYGVGSLIFNAQKNQQSMMEQNWQMQQQMLAQQPAPITVNGTYTSISGSGNNITVTSGAESASVPQARPYSESVDSGVGTPTNQKIAARTLESLQATATKVYDTATKIEESAKTLFQAAECTTDFKAGMKYFMEIVSKPATDSKSGEAKATKEIMINLLTNSPLEEADSWSRDDILKNKDELPPALIVQSLSDDIAVKVIMDWLRGNSMDQVIFNCFKNQFNGIVRLGGDDDFDCSIAVLFECMKSFYFQIEKFNKDGSVEEDAEIAVMTHGESDPNYTLYPLMALIKSHADEVGISALTIPGSNGKKRSVVQSDFREVFASNIQKVILQNIELSETQLHYAANASSEITIIFDNCGIPTDDMGKNIYLEKLSSRAADKGGVKLEILDTPFQSGDQKKTCVLTRHIKAFEQMETLIKDGKIASLTFGGEIKLKSREELVAFKSLFHAAKQQKIKINVGEFVEAVVLKRYGESKKYCPIVQKINANGIIGICEGTKDMPVWTPPETRTATYCSKCKEEKICHNHVDKKIRSSDDFRSV